MSAIDRATSVARDSYGRLLAILAAQSGDILSAEDALGDAFQKALETWPERGVPDNPEAWLLTAARNRQIDGYRQAARRPTAPLTEAQHIAAPIDSIDANAIPDERLKLMFVCAHPAIDESIRTPLMLQTVLGLDAEAIGKAFLVRTSTLAQRLVRAKRKIRDADIPFVIPVRHEMENRVGAVLEAIYGAFAIDWEQQTLDQDLGGEALFLASLLARLLPSNAEALGLAALIAYSLARRDAQYDEHGGFIPLSEQDTQQWDAQLIQHAAALLNNAKSLGELGRFQIEAAIQSVHCERAQTGSTNWTALVQLHEGLLHIAPTVGAAVSRAAAIGHAVSPEAGLKCLKIIEPKATEQYQPAWATRAHLLRLTGDSVAAIEAYRRAISLTAHQPLRAYLKIQLTRLLN